MKILILGSGGREHALAQACLKDPSVEKVMVAPGNAGMLLTEKLEIWREYNCDNLSALAERAQAEKIDLTIIGAEAFAYAGAKDLWLANGMLCLGPKGSSANLEQSKVYSKHILEQAGVKTARYKYFASFLELRNWAIKLSPDEINQWVLKADGPLLGKGVFLPNNTKELDDCLQFFSKCDGQSFIAEQRLTGVEISAFALIEGKRVLYLGDATDYKRLLDGGQGPNTGGMGSIAPSPYLTSDERAKLVPEIFQPVANLLSEQGRPYSGFLFAGLLKESRSSDLYVLEFNVRMGDPETQSLSLLWPQDTASRLLMWEQAQSFDQWPLAKDVEALHVVVAAPNYPGITIPVKTNLSFAVEHFRPEDGVTLISAGLKDANQAEGHLPRLVNQGGRVLGLSASGHSRQLLRENIYRQLKSGPFHHGQWRTDIGAI